MDDTFGADGTAGDTAELRVELLPPADSGARYLEFFVGMHGALLEDAPGLGDAIDLLARETPTTCPKAAWGYEPEQGRGWIQIAAGATAEERSAAAAAFDRDMRRRGLVPIAPAFLR
jgi:hypothetical protein